MIAIVVLIVLAFVVISDRDLASKEVVIEPTNPEMGDGWKWVPTSRV